MSDESSAIVRELAESSQVDENCWCLQCEMRTGLPGGESQFYCAVHRHEDHEPSCLWRRARALYPQEPTS